MLPHHLVLRCIDFQRILFRHSDSAAPRPFLLRWFADPVHLMEVAIRRSVEEIERTIQGYSPRPRTPIFVEHFERALPFPLALFSSNSDTSKYAAKYPFCTVVDISSRYLPKLDAGLFIFSYSDFSEMPTLVERIIDGHPLAYFMFIPCQFIREAFALMTPIFERQERRSQSTRPADLAVATRAYEFVTLLQGTIVQALGCPVPLIAPP
jgi:hypothetical protein